MKKMLNFIFLLIICLVITGGITLQKVHQLVNSKVLIKKEVVFTLKEGTNYIELGKQLYDIKMINQPHVFKWLPLIKPGLSYFKAQRGIYRFTPSMTISDILQLLENRKEAQFTFRFVEGMRLGDYLKNLRKTPWITHTLKDDSYTTVAKAFGLACSEQIEGWFWPGTWIYVACTTDIDILRRAHKVMVSAVDKAWTSREAGLPYKNKNQFMTMASIIEKETAVADERARIASVLVNRLRIGMRLQTDPTVIYGMGKSYTGKISRKDLETPTPYNTYVIRGLPPGPISTPSQASLEAAAHPERTQYLYFVANGKGRHIFNKNLASHNHSVQNYLKSSKKNA